MARDGFKIFDSDTHVGPSMNVLDKYLSSAEKDRLAGWEQWKDTNPRTGRITYTKGRRSYQRRLGTATAETGPARYMAAFLPAPTAPARRCASTTTRPSGSPTWIAKGST